MKKGVINLTTENLISQVETVRADLNMNPLGIPDSVSKAISESLSQLSAILWDCMPLLYRLQLSPL